MQTIYLKKLDIDRANELEFMVKKTHRVKGRVGLSLVLRAGLKLLSEEFERDEAGGIKAILAVSDPAD